MPLIMVSPYKKILQAIKDAFAKTYATLNPYDKPAQATLSNNNLSYASSSGTGCRATVGKSSGKWYWEATVNAFSGTTGPLLGIATGAVDLNYIWDDANPFYTWYTGGQQSIITNNVRAPLGTAVNPNDVIGMALDLDNRTLQFFKNGVAQGTLTNIAAGTYFPVVSDPAVQNNVTFNFGQFPFIGKVPDGFNAGLYSTFTPIYNTLNPNDRDSHAELTNSNLTYHGYVGAGVRGTVEKSSGKWYFEATLNEVGSTSIVGIGITSKAAALNYIWNSTDPHYVWFTYTGQQGRIYAHSGNVDYGPASLKAGDVIGVAVDLDNLKIEYFVNGVSFGSRAIAAGTYYTMVSDDAQGQPNVTTFNYGQNPFKFAAPTGYNAGWFTAYATLNPSDAGGNNLTEDGLKYLSSGGRAARATIGKSSGKWYFEATVTETSATVGVSGAANGPLVGIAVRAVDNIYIWDDPNLFYTWWTSAATLIKSNNVRSAYGAANCVLNDVIGVAFDLDNLKLEFFRNGVSQGSFAIAAGTYYPIVSDSAGGWGGMRMNFGATPFKYAVPNGFNAGVF